MELGLLPISQKRTFNLSSTSSTLFWFLSQSIFSSQDGKRSQPHQQAASLGSSGLDCFYFLEPNQRTLKLPEMWAAFNDETIHTLEHLDKASSCLESVQIWSRVLLGKGCAKALCWALLGELELPSSWADGKPALLPRKAGGQQTWWGRGVSSCWGWSLDGHFKAHQCFQSFLALP